MNTKQYELSNLLTCLETLNKSEHQAYINMFAAQVKAAIHHNTAPVEPIDAGFNPTDETL